jgi:hypothetical protein
LSRTARLAAAAAALVVVACGRGERPPVTGPLQVQEIDCPAPPGSAEPNLSTDGSRVFLSWLTHGGDEQALQYAVLDGGRWSPPQTIAHGDSFFANWADFPSLVPLEDGSFAAHWLWKSSADAYAYGVRVARSADGHEWPAPLVPHRDGTPTEHGFVSLVPEQVGGATAVWLDGRQYAGKQDGDPGAQTALVTADLRLEGFSPEVILDPRVCDCCQTSAVHTSHGMLVAYRDRSDDDVRDIFLVRREAARWTEPYPLARDGWQISGCPVNGPALAARGDAVAAAWFTMDGDSAVVRTASSDNGGRSFSDPLRIDAGRPLGRVDVALLPNGDALVVWLESTAVGGAEIRARRVGRDGRLEDSFRIAGTSAGRASGFPHVVAAGNALIFAWTEEAAMPLVHVARVEVPAAWR